jgi:2-polyprenyl-6-methoxyphenol hydroxylase-like FAD-dependent oxidoreductase
MKIAIVGCGLSGLCLAQGFMKKGIEFQLFERDQDKEARRQGYRITVDEYGLKALEACLPNELFQLALSTAGQPGGYFRILRADQREIFKIDLRAKPGESDKYVGRQMDRAVLRELLFAGLGDYVAFGKNCIQVVEEADRVVLQFAEGTSYEVDLVIAADGSSSTISSAAGQAKPDSLLGRRLPRRKQHTGTRRL